jgi:uncharacterized membrane protein YccF (DUF307 family)
VGLLAYLSIVGIPWGKACLMIGKEVVDRRTVNQKADIVTRFFWLYRQCVLVYFSGYLVSDLAFILYPSLLYDDYWDSVWHSAG